MDFDEISPLGIAGFIVGALIAIIVAKKMGNGVLARMLVGVVVGIVCYFVAAKLGED